jgi:thiosulfate/3-mercaptopyruvate sulfurtransferase
MFDSLISAKQLASMLEAPDLLVFDCRFDLGDVDKGQRLYGESHIPGALYAHLDHHLSSPITPETGRHPLPDPAAFLRWLGECGFDGSQQVVAYDDSGCSMASRLWWLLRCMGHQRVACLDGGWLAWQAADGALETEPVTPKTCDAPALRLDPDCIATTRQVLDNIDEKNFLLVDVRAGMRFRGEQEPIDPVAGHVPGARNLPLMDNLDATGCYLEPNDLRGLYADLIAIKPVEQQVYMCGSGVTACHSVLALASAGFDLPRVYAGSWSEWIRDPARPVATGDA